MPSAFDGVYWSIATVIFFVWGFVFDGFAYSWLTWVIAGVVHNLVHSWVDMEKV